MKLQKELIKLLKTGTNTKQINFDFGNGKISPELYHCYSYLALWIGQHPAKWQHQIYKDEFGKERYARKIETVYKLYKQLMAK